MIIMVSIGAAKSLKAKPKASGGDDGEAQGPLRVSLSSP
jgi:hypothetical protein